jgi:hypothetical protein
MACPTFKTGSEPLILGTGEAYPHNTYSQQEFLQALLEVRPYFIRFMTVVDQQLCGRLHLVSQHHSC